MTTRAFGILLGLTVLCARASGQSDLEWFENEVRPLLIEKCVNCHGPEKSKSGLRVDSRAALLEGGARGAAIEPGDPEASLLIAAIGYDDDLLFMPPKGKLADEEIETLTEWIRRGAPWPAEDSAHTEAAREVFDMEERSKHWAFQPLHAFGTDANIDGLVKAKRAAAGLEAAPPTERVTLLRRLSFDLIGLPPSPEWVEANLDRPLEEVVDELLASEHFGERWGRHWLDLMRYAEGRGHEYDGNIQNAYQYRDYVVRAFNRDVPYDAFVTEHLAGDLLESPRLDPETGANESILGTGWWFLGPEMHSPVDIRLDETERTANQVDVLSRGFLALTVACARCHDHKFDAIRAEDFYALSGFALGGTARQVRFESMEHNRKVAAELESWRIENQDALARTLGEFLAERAAQVSEELRAGAAVAFPSEALRSDEPIPDDLDLLFEDFERDTYAPWTTTGTAFAEGPAIADDLQGPMRVANQRGARIVTSHNLANDADSHEADGHLGTLTSPEFTIVRDYVHFLIGGGEHEETRVELEVDGEVVASVQGRNSDHLHAAQFDVREWRGRTARIVAVDEHTGGWGHVDIDHVVFSNDASEAALAMEYAPAKAAQWARLVAEEAKRYGLTRESVDATARELLRADDDDTCVLHPFAVLARTTRELDDAARATEFASVFNTLGTNEVHRRADSHSEAQLLVDFASPQTFWKQDGYGFGLRSEGQALFGGDRLEVATDPGLYWDPTWDVLKTAEESHRTPADLDFDWEPSGRTVRSATVVLGSGRVFHRVRGAGHVFAVVDAHRMVQGPLHLGTTQTFAVEGNGFGWIEQDLTAYAGHRVHFEFSPRRVDGPSRLAVARVVELEEAPARRAAPGGVAWLRTLATCDPTLESLADRYEESFQESARRLVKGDLIYAEHAQLADWLLSRSDSKPAYRSERHSELVASIQKTSRIAMAMLEGSGVDEFVLSRGNPATPLHVAHRRALEALDGREPLELRTGSGRLELAERLTDPNQPLLARVWVNRLWHHLVGRGIVPSVDDFGVMGDDPTHPELLDFLARRLIGNEWSTKAMIREIVLSSTYGMSSRGISSAEAADPTNALLHRAHRRRLEGEAIRDALLCVSGGIDRTLGGPSVPIHLTDFLQGRGRPGVSGPVDGGGRRSIYLAVHRNFPEPFLQVFDFPPPATTRGRRDLSSVPAQALTMLDDPFVLGEAQRWATRTLEDDSRTTQQRVQRMFEEAFARPAEADELAESVAFVTGRCEHYGVADDDPRAWSDLAHVLFNLNEFLYLD